MSKDNPEIGVCQGCGLPPELCVCKAIKKELKMKRKYDFSQEAGFGLECHGCGKQIKRLPCKMIPVADVEDWVYFHNSCLKKFKKKQSKME